MNNENDLNCATSTQEEVVLIEGEDATADFDRALFCHYCTKGNLCLPHNFYKFRISRKVRRSLIATKRVIKTESTAPSSSVSHSINDVISIRNSSCEFIGLDSDWSDSYSFSREYLKGRVFEMSDNPIKQNQSLLNISITFEQMLNIRRKRLNKIRQKSIKLDQSNSVKAGKSNAKRSDTLVFSSTEEDNVVVIDDTFLNEDAVNKPQCNNGFTNNNVQNCTVTSATLNCEQSPEENSSLCNITDITCNADKLQLSEEIIEIIDKSNLKNSYHTSVTTTSTDNHHLVDIIEVLDDTVLLPSSENILASCTDDTCKNDTSENVLTSSFYSCTSNNCVSSNGILNSIENTEVNEELPNIVKENQNIESLENNSNSLKIITGGSIPITTSSSRKQRKRRRTGTNSSVICVSDSINKSSDDIIFVSEGHSTTSLDSPQPKKRKLSVVVIDEDNSVSSSSPKQSRRNNKNKNNKQRIAQDSFSRFKQKRNLRTIIIDGSNVAYGHANGKYFSVKGLSIAIEHFLKKGHKVVAFVPQFRSKSGESSNPKLLRDLADKGLVAFTPSRDVNGIRIASYDDRFIIEYASGCDGIVVSNDNYRDLINERVSWRRTIENRLLMYTWVGDIIMLPDDPLGKHGPRLCDFLSF